MQPLPTETHHSIQGPAGQLEVVTTSPEENNDKQATAIICHPHPLHGGTLTNKVVTTLARTFRDLGLRTVRFNFRGVGKSAGQYDAGKGETEDLLAVVAWATQQNPTDAIWLAGFSFGAYIAIRAATQIPVAQLVTIAPPVTRFTKDPESDSDVLRTIDPWNMTSLPPVTCPWLLVQGEQDEIISASDVITWATSLNPPPTLIKMPTAGHFFHGQLMELRRNVENTLSKRV